MRTNVELADIQEAVLFTLIGIELALIYAKTLKPFEKQVLLRRKLKYLEWLGELYLAEDEQGTHVEPVNVLK